MCARWTRQAHPAFICWPPENPDNPLPARIIVNTKLLLSTLALTLALTGCATTTHYVDQKNDKVAVMGLDYKDFENAASEMVNQMLASPLMVHPKASQGGRDRKSTRLNSSH